MTRARPLRVARPRAAPLLPSSRPAPAAACSRVDELRGAARLACEAASGVADVVEAMHVAIGGGPAVLGRPLARTVRLLTRPVYGGVRLGVRLVGAAVDDALAGLAPRVAPLVDDRVPGPAREAALAILNGVLGDHLARSGNPLAIAPRLRSAGRPLALDAAALRRAFPRATGRLLVLVHGSCANDLQWRRHGHDHGAALARDVGFTPVYLHYNSGLHVSENGRALAALLEALVAAWPAPVDDLVILGHSMGGLVARSACHLGEAAGHGWRRRLHRLVCLGTPHHGAPLERGGSFIDLLLGVSRYSAPLVALGRIRSAGVTDLRFGNVLDEDWRDRDRFAPGRDARTPLPLPEGVACYAIAATTDPPERASSRPTDGLVPVESALGRHVRPELTLAFPEERRYVVHRTTHLDLLGRPEVYAQLRRWLAQ